MSYKPLWGSVFRGRTWHIMISPFEALCDQMIPTHATSEGLPPKGALVCDRCFAAAAKLFGAASDAREREVEPPIPDA